MTEFELTADDWTFVEHSWIIGDFSLEVEDVHVCLIVSSKGLGSW